MRVVYCKAGQSTKILEIEPDLKMMQGLVGGNIETYPYEIAPMVFVMNEEAKLQHARPNRFIAHGRDMICGDFFVAALGKNEDGEGDIIGLTEDQERLVMATVETGRI